MSRTATSIVAQAIGCPSSTATTADITQFEAFWGVDVAQDLKRYWKTWGTGRGFVSDKGDVPFVSIYSPSDALNAFGMEPLIEHMPPGCAPFGDDGSGEMIVFVEGRGFGLLQLVHAGIDDVLLVDASLEGFFLKTVKDAWFSD